MLRSLPAGTTNKEKANAVRRFFGANARTFNQLRAAARARTAAAAAAAQQAAAAAAAQQAAATAAAQQAAAAAAAPAGAAPAQGARPELIGVLTRDGRDLTGAKYKLTDNNGQQKLLDNFIDYKNNSYFISKIKDGPLTNVAANTFNKVATGSTSATYYVLNNTLNNNPTLFLYKLPITKGGRRRTKAKSKSKSKASRKTNRRNRRY
jgi:hypothetical protein